MKLNDIKDSVVGIIKTQYPSREVYDEAVKAGFVEGGFVVRVFPIVANPQGIHYRNKTNMVSITYKGEPETFDDMNSVYNKLEDAFSKPLKVVSTDTISQEQTAFVVLKNFRREDPELDKFVFMFDFDFLDIVQETQDHEKAETLDVVINSQ